MSINKEELDEQFKKILEARDKICDNFCKYTAQELAFIITQEELENICEDICPLSKIQGGEDGLSDNTQQIIE